MWGRNCSPLLLLLLCTCACWTAQPIHNHAIRTIGHQNNAYYAALAEGCDVFLKLKPLDPQAIYISERTNLATAVLPAIITNLHPERVIYSTKGVYIELSDDCFIGWGRDPRKTNVWNMTVSLHTKERTVYEEPSTKYCLVDFGVSGDSDYLVTTNRVVHRPGLEYAWKLTIYSREDHVRIKDVFELPGRGVWGDAVSMPDGITLVARHISPDEKSCTTEYDLTIRKGCAETEFIQPYILDKDDPIGVYRISLFLDGQPLKKLTFRVVPEK
jgi:hypothetical protein